MKNIYLSIVLLCATASCFAQDCAQLYITEIVFERDSINPSNFIKNYSLELFNPQEVSVPLSGYTIKLIPVSGTPTAITITDSILPKGTYVISNRHADSAVQQLTDLLSDYLDYPSYRQIELWYDTTLIDKIGQDGVVDPDSIDLMQALLDPANYLDQLEIDLSSLKNLVIRRNPVRTHGNPNFDDLANEWYVFPNGTITDLHNHNGVCTGIMSIQFQSDYQETFEGDYNNAVVEAVGFDGTFIEVAFNAVQGSTPFGFPTPPAYTNSADAVDPTGGFLSITSTNTNLAYHSYPDATFEPDETFFYWLSNIVVGFDVAEINFAKEYMRIVIKNDDATGINDLDYNPIVTFPNPANTALFIQMENNERVDRTVLYNAIGQVVYENTSPVTVLSLTDFTPGMYLLKVTIGGKEYTKDFYRN